MVLGQLNFFAVELIDHTGPRPPAPNLTPGGELRGWTEADFVALLSTLTTPTGRVLTGDMPPEYGGLTDDEISAVWLYLQSLPPIENN